MIVKVLAVFGFVAVAYAADLSMGSEGGKLIFEQNVTASPAICRQVQLLTVNATDTTDELISRVVVIDNRPDKDGEATVVEGGEGHKNVTLQLKSPTVFRGFDFSVQVFATEENEKIPNHLEVETENPQEPVQFPNDPVATGFETQNTQVLDDLNVDSNQEPTNDGDIIIGAPALSDSSTTEVNKDDQQNIYDTEEQKIKDQTLIPTPADIDDTQYTTKPNENANKTVLPETDESWEKELDLILENNSTENFEEEDTLKEVPVMPQAESDDLINFRDDEENRKTRRSAYVPVVPALPAYDSYVSDFPKELTNDDQTTLETDISCTSEKVEENSEPEVSSTAETTAGEEKSFPTIIPVTEEVPSTTEATELTTETKLPESENTTEDLESDVKGHYFKHHHHHFEHHHAHHAVYYVR